MNWDQPLAPKNKGPWYWQIARKIDWGMAQNKIKWPLEAWNCFEETRFKKKAMRQNMRRKKLAGAEKRR
jgi:hypothetical protein